ncbi:MAG: bifunctional riboflavin kinase/FMN adenylyltransferase, partial [Lachnospiraceae bacterium]|nr:bifunctional riboflavin kinase/FMN adenylyltransferase [Lachnospiraceae bacterium]
MKCIDNLNDYKLNNTAVTIGKFDGLHKGHSKLVSVLKANAKDYNKTVLTFSAKPIDVINHEQSFTIVSETEKRLLFEKAGMDYYINLPLNKDFLDLSPEQFVREILVGMLDVRLVICGPDFTFGKYGAGNTNTLKMLGRKYGFDVIVVEKEQYRQHDIGS